MPSSAMHPLLFQPIYRRYLWGGRRFATAIGRELPAGDDFAESWELVDRVADQSVVALGPLAGTTLGQLVREQGRAILGRHAPRRSFPLLFKFLDACRDLSVQVHPDDARAANLGTPDLGKTEAWYVVDAAPGSRVYAGLRFDPDLPEKEKHRVFTQAVRAGRCEEMLHSFFAQPGDCIFIPAGTVHAIGAGLLVAEIQQSSDVTYRLHDWNRTGPDGKLRPLHIDAGLDAVTKTVAVSPAIATRTSDPVVSRLVSSPYFLFDEVEPVGQWSIGGDNSFHFLAVLAGEVRLESRWQLPPLTRGACVLLPAEIASQTLETTAAFGCQPKLLHIALP